MKIEVSKVVVSEVECVVDVVLIGTEGAQVLPPLWLRERSQRADQIDPVNHQRLVDPHRLSPDLAVVDASCHGDALWLRYSDGHQETLSVAVLERTLELGDDLPAVVAWTARAGRPATHHWPTVATDDDALLAALRDFLAYGTIVVAGAGSEPSTVITVAERFGNVRDTNWGRVFDVRSVPKPNDLAYTPIPLGPHTDNPYRDPTPGIQLLHCLVNDTTGGLSTLVDAVAVCEQLRDEDPDGFELLATVPVQFRFLDATDDLRYTRTVVQRDHRGAVTGLAYSPRMDYLPVMPVAQARAYQRARRRLSALLVDPAFEVRFTLEPGEVEVFDNARVLHGRTGFDPQEGLRHLQGCYIDNDAPRSRYRVLAARKPLMQQVGFTQMRDGTKADYDLLHGLEQRYIAELPDRILANLRLLDDGLGGYQVSRLEHSLQSATRAERDGADVDWVVAALVHDIGDALAPENHSQLAAAVLRPYVREEVAWAVLMHGVFQQVHYGHHTGVDPDAREAYRGHPWFDSCADFCERWDQASFDPSYPSEPLEHFEPMVREVFSRPAFGPHTTPG